MYVGFCLLPHALRLQHPSIYSDDVFRIADLQMMRLGAMMVRPINEHMAPLFELVSWTTWNVAGRRLTAAPLAFTIASFLPFLLCAVVLGVLVRREFKSTTTALAAIAVFDLSFLYVDTAWWYSASSFAWALLFLLLGWLLTKWAEAADRVPLWILAQIGVALASLAAPAFSSIGLLAGPVIAVRSLAARGARGPLTRSRALALVPLVGTASYLALSKLFGLWHVLAASARANADFRFGLLTAMRVPTSVLAPALIGVERIDDRVPVVVWMPLFVLAIAGILVWAWRAPARPVLLGGLALILGGYSLTYCARRFVGDDSLPYIGRYHLFPQTGFILIVAAGLRPWLCRFDAAAHRTWSVAAIAAALLLATHLTVMKQRSFGCLYPDQPQALAAMEHMQALCREHQITREQALRALIPLHPLWFDRHNALMMLGPGGEGSLVGRAGAFRPDVVAGPSRARGNLRQDGSGGSLEAARRVPPHC
jgi:hypothetical protein